MVTLQGRAATAMAAGLVLLAAGCGRPPGAAELQAKFAEAERLCLDQKYEEAKAHLKAYLLVDPLHPGAHYYLARTYMASLDIRETGLAENEFQMALNLFERRDRESGIQRFDARYFELICNLDSATALWIQAQILAQDRSLIPIAQESLARARKYVERGRAINPNATEVAVVDERIRELAAGLSSLRR
jgi:tetratricopeptide (TPR) repeat protein